MNADWRRVTQRDIRERTDIDGSDTVTTTTPTQRRALRETDLTAGARDFGQPRNTDKLRTRAAHHGNAQQQRSTLSHKPHRQHNYFAVRRISARTTVFALIFFFFDHIAILIGAKYFPCTRISTTDGHPR
ncbi:hypothetical protein [Pandoraea faecigallinarum]|uniref:hypothetical protein n=1 Tax=Pandoraea faecigallinarum TaxID=656179 RepID=UPI0012F51261|nr:hypothetical protein [Pandoraea faecigallinarum]